MKSLEEITSELLQPFNDLDHIAQGFLDAKANFENILVRLKEGYETLKKA